MVCTYPGAGDLSAESLYHVILQEVRIGPKMQPTNPRDYPNAKPAVWHRLEQLDPETAKSLVGLIQPHKHVPEHIKSCDMWVGLVGLMTMIDWLWYKTKDGGQVDAALSGDRLPGTVRDYVAYVRGA